MVANGSHNKKMSCIALCVAAVAPRLLGEGRAGDVPEQYYLILSRWAESVKMFPCGSTIGNGADDWNCCGWTSSRVFFTVFLSCFNVQCCDSSQRGMER